MTEADWMACTEPRTMLWFLSRRGNERKLRLFAVACCRRVAHLFASERCDAALATAERYADDPGVDVAARRAAAALEELPRATTAADAAWNAVRCALAASADWESAWCEGHQGDDLYLVRNARYWADQAAHAYEADASTDADSWQRVRECELNAQAHLLRDICGNPFRALLIDRSWATPAVTSLAQMIYADHASARMRELADALAAAGCTDADVLAHCRGPGPHVRGCWVVDLILGKN